MQPNSAAVVIPQLTVDQREILNERPTVVPAGSPAAVLPQAVLPAGLTMCTSMTPLRLFLTDWGPTVSMRRCSTPVLRQVPGKVMPEGPCPS